MYIFIHYWVVVLGCLSFLIVWNFECLDNASVSDMKRLDCEGKKMEHLGRLGLMTWHLVKITAYCIPSPPLEKIRVTVIVWRLRGNIIRTALCRIVWHNVHSQQHTYMGSSYRSIRLGLSHWDPYAVHRGGCLELYYCNMVEWFWWDSRLISTTNWFPSVLWDCWFGYLACKHRPRNDL